MSRLRMRRCIPSNGTGWRDLAPLDRNHYSYSNKRFTMVMWSAYIVYQVFNRYIVRQWWLVTNFLIIWLFWFEGTDIQYHHYPVVLYITQHNTTKTYCIWLIVTKCNRVLTDLTRFKKDYNRHVWIQRTLEERWGRTCSAHLSDSWYNGLARVSFTTRCPWNFMFFANKHICHTVYF